MSSVGGSMNTHTLVRLGELLRQVDRSVRVEESSTYRLLGVRLQGNGPFVREQISGMETSAVKLNKVEVNDFIYSRLFAWRGAFGVIDEDLSGCYVSNEFPIFVADDFRLDVRYLAYWFQLPSVWRAVEERCSGSTPTTRNRLKEKNFLDLKIILPPIDIQKLVVVRLDSLVKKTGVLEENLGAIERDAERLLAQRFQEAIENAPLRPMRDVAPLVRREVKIDDGCQYTELGVRSFYKGTFHRRTVFGVDFSWQTLYEVKSGDLVFSNIMAWEKAISIARPEDDACVGNHRMLTCEAVEGVMLPGFLFYYFTTEDGFSKIYAASPGTAARNRTMTARALMDIEVPVPSIDVQQDFVLLQSKILALKSKHAAIRESSAALLPAILERIFSMEEQSHG